MSKVFYVVVSGRGVTAGSPRGHYGFLGVVKVSPKGCSTDSQKCPNNEKFGKIEGNAPKVDQRGAVGVGVGSEPGWDVLGVDPKANLRLSVDDKRWFFLTGY